MYLSGYHCVPDEFSFALRWTVHYDVGFGCANAARQDRLGRLFSGVRLSIGSQPTSFRQRVRQ